MLQSLAMTCAVVLLVLLLQPSMDYVEDESFATLPNLGVKASWRVFGIELGLILMLITAVLQLVRRSTLATGIASVATVAVVGALLWVAAAPLAAIGNANLLVFFVLLVGATIAIGVPLALLGARALARRIGNLNLFVFFVLIVGVAILVGVPIGFAFGSRPRVSGFTTSTPLSVVVNRLDQGMSQPLLLAIPMFIFLGLLIEIAGLAKAMIELLASLLGSVRGGLYYVLLAAMMLVSGISGSKAADMAAIAPGLFPEMRRRGAKDGDLVALLASSAAMADTIPPSLVLITFGSVTGISIASLFTAGLMPAVVLAAVLAILVFRRSRDERPPTRSKVDAAVVRRVVLRALPALILPFLIRWSVVDGVATATEVSTIGIVYALIVGMTIYRPMNWSRLYPVLVETAALSGAILFVIGTATGMAWALTQSGFSSDLATTMQRVAGGPYGFLAITIVVFVLLGNILEGIPAILLFAPLLLPVSHAFGIHDVHYAMVVVIAMSIGLFAPPFGIGFYAACAIGKVAPEQAVRHVWRYLAALMVGLVLIAAVPWFSTGLL